MLINEYATILLSFTQKPYEYPQSQDYGAQKNEQIFSHGKSFKIPLNKNHQAERLSKVCTVVL